MKGLWIALAILGGIVLLAVLVLFFAKIKIRLRYKDELELTATFLGIPVPLFEDPPNVLGKKDLSRCHNPERVLERELKKRRNAAKRALKKKRKSAQSTIERHARGEAAEPLSLKESIELIFALLKSLYRATKGELNIHVKRMHLHIASEDAAKTAILYGVAVQGAAYFLDWIERHFNKLQRKKGAMEIIPDYTARSTTAQIDIVCTLYLSQYVRILAKFGTIDTEHQLKKWQKALRRVTVRIPSDV